MARIYINGQPVTPLQMFTPPKNEVETNPLATVANVLQTEEDEKE